MKKKEKYDKNDFTIFMYEDGKEVKLVKLFKNVKTGVYEESNLSSNKH